MGQDQVFGIVTVLYKTIQSGDVFAPDQNSYALSKG